MKKMLGAVLLVVGCAHDVYTYTATGTAAQAKAADCDFKVTTSAMDTTGYTEIGVLERPHWEMVNDIAKFKRAASRQVCDAGGDLVIGEVNGYGIYIRGTVYRRN